MNSILSKRPNILIIQECENLEKIKFDDRNNQPSDLLWI